MRNARNSVQGVVHACTCVQLANEINRGNKGKEKVWLQGVLARMEAWPLGFLNRFLHIDPLTDADQLLCYPTKPL